MLNERTADALRDALEPLLSEFEVTAVPWHSESPKAEHIVTVWEDDAAMLDIFEVGKSYLLRRVGRGALVGIAGSVEEIPEIVRSHHQNLPPLASGDPRR